MSYYILPKNYNKLNVNPKSRDCLSKQYLSYSLLSYYFQIKEQIYLALNVNNDTSNNDTSNNDTSNNDTSNNDTSNNDVYETIVRIVNPYQYIFLNVTGSKLTISKLAHKSNLFYDLLEISKNLSLFEDFKHVKIRSLHITPEYDISIQCQQLIRDGDTLEDEHAFFTQLQVDDNNDNDKLIFLHEKRFDYIFYETNLDKYIPSFINSILIVLKNQSYNGNIIIKIGHIFFKPIIDILYLLSSFYEKVYIVKPNTSNVISFERYIVCKKFQYNEEEHKTYLKFNYYTLLVFLKKLEGQFITDILDFHVPYYFKSKVDDLNIIIGQQQLEALDQIICIIKSKNRNEKIETMKKINIQKSVSWCDKYHIPCNRFNEKINIFLPLSDNLEDSIDETQNVVPEITLLNDSLENNEDCK